MQPSDVDILVLIIVLMILIALAFSLWLARNRNVYLSWLRLRAVARIMPCAPTSPRFPFPSECLGRCLEGDGDCTTVETRPWLIFWRQAARCACVHPADGAAGPGGKGQGSGAPGPTPPPEPAPPVEPSPAPGPSP